MCKPVIKEMPQVNERFTIVDSKKGLLTLNTWMLSGQGGTSRKFVVKGHCDFPSNAKDTKVFANVDMSHLKRQVYGNDIAIAIDDYSPGDTGNKLIKCDTDGKFTFGINVSVDPHKFHSGEILQTPCRLKLKINVRCEYSTPRFIFGTELHITEFDSENERVFDVFIHRGLENTKTWIGLDPGTIGTCACIGTNVGGSISNPNIRQMCNGIIPSCVIIPQTCEKQQCVTDYQPVRDYLFGLRALQMWKAEVENGSTAFVSIKKLLGYNKTQKISVPMADGTKEEFSGVDIAHLLIKGVDSQIQSELECASEEERKVIYGRQNQRVERLVVAIPNNYTLSKTLDMVESIKRLGKYSEIRCIYEPEAILFNYIMKEYSNIVSRNGESVMVFDMGGATINTSIYNLKVTSENEKVRVNVVTVGRIGYAVGGDNIDFALLESLMDIYTRSLSNGELPEEKRMEIERENKNLFLPKIFQFKLALIEASKGVFGEMLSNEQLFLMFINDLFSPLVNLGYSKLDEELLKLQLVGCKFDDIWEDYREMLVNRILNSRQMKEYVYDRVAESIADLLGFCENNSIDRLIFSGRSVLFPGIKDEVRRALSNQHAVVWDGLDDDELKTAVARGACWYGMYGTSISLDNEIITSSYGFKQIKNGVTEFVPVIRCKNKFDEYSNSYTACLNVNSCFDQEGNNLEFFQVMGSNFEGIFTENKRYKLNWLGVEDIYTDTESVDMRLDRQDNVEYKVNFIDGQSVVSQGLQSNSCDIFDDNDRAYAFATLIPKNNKPAAKTVVKEKESVVRNSRI